MGGRGSGSGFKRKSPAPTYSALTSSTAQALKDKYELGFSDATKKSVSKYISAAPFQQGYSISQTMNHIINEGIDLQHTTVSAVNSKLNLSLTQREFTTLQKTDANIDAAMHPIGQDVELQRGCHAGDMRRLFGITNYSSLSEAQLQARLVGGTFQNTAVMSTSYDVTANPFLGSGPVAGGREIVYNIKAKAGTPMVWGAMNQAEAILGKGITWRITGVRYTGKIAHPRNGSPTKQLEIDIETV